jgi:hypothetical protein
MTTIVITLQRGPGGEPVGQLRAGPGPAAPFTGWLHLIRLLEDQLRQPPPETSAAGGSTGPGPPDP